MICTSSGGNCFEGEMGREENRERLNCWQGGTGQETVGVHIPNGTGRQSTMVFPFTTKRDGKYTFFTTEREGRFFFSRRAGTVKT